MFVLTKNVISPHKCHREAYLVVISVQNGHQTLPSQQTRLFGNIALSANGKIATLTCEREMTQLNVKTLDSQLCQRNDAIIGPSVRR